MPKLTPQEYSNILNQLNLNILGIFLEESSLKIKEHTSNLKDVLEISLKLSDKYSYIEKDESIYFDCNVTLRGTITNNNDAELFLIKARFKMIQSKNVNASMTKDFFEIYKDTSLSLMCWPYFREYINNLSTRTSLPPIVLPIKR